MTTLTPEQRALGRSNADEVLGQFNRRRFLQAAAVAPAAGAFFFWREQKFNEPIRAAIIGTGNEGCGAMIHDSNPEYIKYIGVCDIRPSQRQRALDELRKHPGYSKEDVDAIEKNKLYANVDEMLADDDIEVVVIALPLWLHAPVAIKAMRAGKHVFCEKLMAHSIGECKAMCRVAHETNRFLAVGHQRHYSTLYDNANFLVTEDLLGEIRHIRTLWHRNNACPRIKKDENGNLVYNSQGEPEYLKDKDGNILYFDGWKPEIPPEDASLDTSKLAVSLKNTKGREWTYKYDDVKQLVQWRLYDRTGAGLMAELGSHQLDACSIFLGKVHPLAVTGIGGTFFYEDGRQVDDHVFVTFEFPNKVDDKGLPVGNDRVVVTYSSINTNAFENYGECVYGSKATMIVEQERDLLLYKEIDRNTWKGGGGPRETKVSVEKKGDKPALTTSPSLAGVAAAAVGGGGSDEAPSRGYREELEHFAYCIRNNTSDKIYDVDDAKLLPRCRGQVALADAVIALTSNLAMREKRRIDYDPAWFDFNDDSVPDKSEDDLEMAV